MATYVTYFGAWTSQSLLSQEHESNPHSLHSQVFHTPQTAFKLRGRLKDCSQSDKLELGC